MVSDSKLAPLVEGWALRSPMTGSSVRDTNQRYSILVLTVSRRHTWAGKPACSAPLPPQLLRTGASPVNEAG